MGDFEQLVLVALMRLDGEAYGMQVQRELAERLGRTVAVGAVYTTLDRLERKGLVASRMGEPTPERGGRRRKHYRLGPAGKRALATSRHELDRMWDGLTVPGAPEGGQ
jgi:PadR family transcriptional regulator PadR